VNPVILPAARVSGMVEVGPKPTVSEKSSAKTGPDDAAEDDQRRSLGEPSELTSHRFRQGVAFLCNLH
jgi:hypothetical protein